MGIYKAILKRRTIRRFQDKPVRFSALKKCINAARLSPSARNTQELEFIAVSEKEQVSRLLSAVSFGGIVKEKGMRKGEEPKAFIIIIAAKAKAGSYTSMNAGIAAEAIVLAAWEQGIGSCIMGAIQRQRIAGLLHIPGSYEIPIAIALGYPREKPVAEEAKKGDLYYWIDAKERLHVPKRPLEEVMHRNEF